MLRLTSSLPLAATVLLLCSCAGDKNAYPSLARRPVERISGNAASETPAPSPATEVLPADLAARIEVMVARARSADAGFRERVEHTRGTVTAASGAASGSEAWAQANMELSALTASRNEVLIALADLDGLYATRRIEGHEAPEIRAARATVEAMAMEENAVLAGLNGKP